MLFVYSVGYLINSIAIGNCKLTKEDQIPSSSVILESTEKVTTGSVLVDMTSPAYCAHFCRKKHNGFCPFLLAGITWSDRGFKNAGNCIREVPQQESDCNHDAYRHSEFQNSNAFQIYSTQNLGTIRYLIVCNICSVFFLPINVVM